MINFSQLTIAFGNLAKATQAAFTAMSVRQAVYVAPGGDIQAAIDALPAAGGTVTLGVGDYTITSAIMPRGHVVFRGAGRDATMILAVGCGGFEYAPAVGNTHPTDWWMTWLDMTVRGDYTPGKDGLHLRGGLTAAHYAPHYSITERVRFERFARHGIYIEANVYGFTARDVEVRDCDGDGMLVTDQSNAVRVDNSRFMSNNGAGVRIGAGGGLYPIWQASVRDCVIEDNRDGGLILDYVYGATVSGNYFEGNATSYDTPTGRTNPGYPVTGRNLWIGSTKTSRGASVTGNTFAAAIYKATSGLGYHIALGDGGSIYAQGVDISGNWFDSKATKAILNATSSDVVISPANFYDGATDRALTRGSGVFNGTTGTTITHNFGTTGYRVAITPTATHAGRWWVAKGTNSFTVKSTDASDAGAFDWLILQGS